MRRKDREVRDPKQIEEILNHAKIREFYNL